MDIRSLLDKANAAETLDVLAHMGFADPAKALGNVTLIAEGVENPLFLEMLPGLITACSQSADPDSCLNNFERVSSSFEERERFLGTISWNPDSVKVLAPLFASCHFLTRFIMGEPEGMLSWLLAPERLERARERDDLVRECLEACPDGTPLPDAMARLRRFKYMEFLRITARDLMGIADLSETTLELSNLADAALEAALRVGMHELDRKYGHPRHTPEGGRARRCPFTVIAMGKLGGRELNFSSDIDIMYLYLTDEGETTGPQRITNHQYFVKLGELVNKIIGEKTPDGFVFRVDTRLRPEGERGDLAQGLSGYEVYYESWGQTWERSALIKARPCAGDMELGRAFTEMIRPFVFRKYLDYSAIGEIRDMKTRIEKGACRQGKEIDVKLGEGGIREIEFFISALQLIYGGRERGIRERGSLKALHRLALQGLVSFDEQARLTRAYEFLRTAEHRLQVVDERQVHSLPHNPAEIRALARRMGYRDTHDISAGDAFLSEYKGHTKSVREIYNGLLAEQAVNAQDTGGELDLVLASEVSEEDAAKALAGRGFREPFQAYRNVLLLRDGSPGSPLTPRSRNLFIRIIPALISGCAESPDPDMALVRLESFITAFGSREAIYQLVTENPDVAKHITKLLGSSEYFSRLLISYPEMSDALLLTGEEGLDKTGDKMSAELFGEMAKAGNFAEKMDRLRRFKHAEEMRIGIKDILSRPGHREVSRDLTALAVTVLEGALAISMDDLVKKYGGTAGKGGSGIAVVGLGKFGAGELGYGSDLDIIFIYDPAGYSGGGISAAEFYARLAERVIFALSSLTMEGYAFRVDTRLRPGGSKGVLAHTLGSIEEYYMHKASVWEVQALTRAWAVSGDARLIARFETMRKKILKTPREREPLAKAVRAMRARIEKEMGGKGKGRHIKYGKGGIVDIEFTIQYIQLLHGSKNPEVLTADTHAALDIITGLGFLGNDDGRALKESYSFLKELESMLRITTSQPEILMPDDPGKLAALAARMGVDGKGGDAGDKLLREYDMHAGRVRDILNRIVS